MEIFQLFFMGKNDIDRRVVEWIRYLVDNKIYKSEAEYLRVVGFGPSKLSEAKKGKAGFRTEDIGLILINNENLNARWLMTGQGEMLLQGTCNQVDSNKNELHLELINKMLDMQTELTKLKIENEELQDKLGISKVG